MRPPKTDFRFLFYTPKNIYLKGKNVLFLNAYKVKKIPNTIIMELRVAILSILNRGSMNLNFQSDFIRTSIIFLRRAVSILQMLE